MDAKLSLLIDMTKNEYDGAPFNGPSLVKTLDELSMEQIGSTETSEGYSVWGIVLHLIYWKFTLSRLLGGDGGFSSFPYEDKDWPAVPGEKTTELWKSALADQETVHKAYIKTVESLPSERLSEIIPEWKCSYLQALSWMATHDLYHAAQIRNMGVL